MKREILIGALGLILLSTGIASNAALEVVNNTTDNIIGFDVALGFCFKTDGIAENQNSVYVPNSTCSNTNQIVIWFDDDGASSFFFWLNPNDPHTVVVSGNDSSGYSYVIDGEKKTV